ncbi:MAG: histidinol-phosphate transaminase [Desulfitobacterium hafniense]|nr:histidinol-phosphate transaminase [Desulfitobacterium hafniense]
MEQIFQEFLRDEVRDLPIYVPGKPIEDVKRELGLTEVYKLASNENPWGPSPKALEAMKEALNDIARYPEASGYNLRSALSKSFNVPMDYFLFGSGSDEIVGMIAGAFFKPGDEILMGRPSFPRYETVTRFIGAVPVELPLVDGYYPLHEFLDKITPRTKAIFICNPNNPSGTVRTAEDIKDFVSKVPKNILLVFDEAYIEFTDERFSGTIYLEEDRPVIILRTFSKAYGLAGIRIGFAIARPELIAGLNKVRGPFNVSSVAFAGALAAFEDQNYLEEVVSKNKEERTKLTAGLEGLGGRVLPSQTNFIFVTFQGIGSELSNRLLSRGLIVRPGAAFGYPDAMRITVGTAEENQILLQVMEDLLK